MTIKPHPFIVGRERAHSYLAMCNMGKMRVVKEFKDGNSELFLISPSGATVVNTGRYKHMFMKFLAENGNGDGLFPGTDQTAEAKE